MRKIALLVCLCFVGIAAASAQKVFKGTWTCQQGTEVVTMTLDLYAKTIENGMDMDGAMCFGVITRGGDSMFYYTVDKVTVKGNTAILDVFDGETSYFKLQLTYLPQNKSIEILNKNKGNQLPEKSIFKKHPTD